MIIKRIDVFSAGKIMGIIGAAIGLIAGIIVLLISLLGGALGGSDTAALGAIGGFAAVIILPIAYGIGTFIAGIIQAFIYNLAAGFVGGIKIETE